MHSWQLLLDRIKRNGRSKYKMWKSILDWTVLLYIAIPAMVAGGIIYRSWWMEIPEWSDQFTLFFLNFLAYTFCWFGQNRTYVQEADGLFLLKHRPKFIRMKQWALAYSVGQAVLKSLLLTLVLLPFLLFHFSLATSEIVGFLLLLIGGTAFIMAIQTVFFLKDGGWKQKVYQVIVFIVLLFGHLSIFPVIIYQPIYSIAVAILLISVALALLLPRARTTTYFHEEVRKENELRSKMMNSIFQLSPDMEKPKVVKRKKPFLFRQSKRIFKRRTEEHGLMELFIKILIRNFTYLSGYFRLVSVTGAAIVVVPPILFKVLILIGFSFFIRGWMISLWDQVILSHPISKKYETNPAFYHGRKKMSLYSSFPAVFFLVILLIVNII
ncbi:ABC transporter permease [Bacillus sp. FJAT-42315]|uniref:ABC transporter permease n=1 Tax=Bacillus sp. FJAT-42315 TaxID=2014077 RepID=UPI000C23AF0D|nr:ABC transporter permease [Bacillus sp. FJAT-42315]